MKHRQFREKSRKNKGRRMFCLVVVSLLSLSMVPGVQAYFSAKLESNTLLINVFQHDKSTGSSTISADVAFENNDSYDTKQSFLTERMTMDVTEDDPYIRFHIRLDGYPDPGDIYIPSIQLHHMHHSTHALSAQMEGDALAVTFNKSEIASWFSDWEESFQETHFTVTGQGYVMGMELFDFTGSTSLTVFMQKSTEVPKGELEGPVLKEDLLVTDEGLPVPEEETEGIKIEEDDTDVTDNNEAVSPEVGKDSPEVGKDSPEKVKVPEEEELVQADEALADKNAQDNQSFVEGEDVE